MVVEEEEKDGNNDRPNRDEPPPLLEMEAMRSARSVLDTRGSLPAILTFRNMSKTPNTKRHTNTEQKKLRPFARAKT